MPRGILGPNWRISTNTVRAMGYLSYYLVLLVASAVAQYPPLLAGLLLVFLVRRWLPDPVVLADDGTSITSIDESRRTRPA